MKVLIFTAEAAKTKELGKTNRPFGVVEMGRGIKKVAMGFNRFVEHRGDESITIDSDNNILEWYAGLTDLPCELESRMEIINKVNKLLKFATRTWCCTTAVICVSSKVIRYGISVLFEDLFFRKSNKQGSIVGTHFSSHDYTTNLLVMLTIKGKIVGDEHQPS